MKALLWLMLGNNTVGGMIRLVCRMPLTLSVVPSSEESDKDPKKSALSLFLCGYVAVEKRTLLSDRQVVLAHHDCRTLKLLQPLDDHREFYRFIFT